MIRLITGLPGAGKSLKLVQLIQAYLAEGRPVYVDGLDGLQAFGWEPCSAREWQNLPDGSVIVVDEAQKTWPTRRLGDVPAEIRALSEHRHHGLDFVLATQHPTMMDKYVRTLVGEHQHVLRQFGMQASRVITWTECQEDPQSLGTRQRGTEALWTYPKGCYELYKSATLHTVKRKVPFRLVVIPFALVAVIALGWWGYHSIGRIAGADPVTAAKMTGGVGSGLAGGPKVPKYADAAAFALAFTPRIAGLPWSAPAFDDRPVTVQPQLLCVVSEAKGCRCYTEQITTVVVPIMDCMRYARDGVYNPFRPAVSDRSGAPTAPPDGPSWQASRSGPGLPQSAVAVGASGPGVRTEWPHPDFAYKVPFPKPGAIGN